jgi:glutamine cyclotransferase
VTLIVAIVRGIRLTGYLIWIGGMLYAGVFLVKDMVSAHPQYGGTTIIAEQIAP